MSSYTVPPSETRLFKPLKVGNFTLQHRLVFPPLTRMRNNGEEHVANAGMAKYYADRASAPGTLIISEATAVAHTEEGNPGAPGFVSEEQSEAWAKVIKAVHDKGSFYFQQIWGMGRATNPEYMAKRGFPYRSSSTEPMAEGGVAPRAMTEEEILDMIQSFVDTAKRAVAAGADGVEIHSAHGYLLDQFLSDNVNKRTDKWGGSIENRARLTLEVVKAVVAAVGAEKVAIRLSPYAVFQGIQKTDIQGQYTYLINQLKNMNAKFAYLSLVEARGDPATLLLDDESLHKGKTLDFILEAWDNLSPVLVAGGYEPITAGWAVEEHYKKWDVMVAFGRHWIANPDLVFRIKHGLPLNKYDRTTFYVPSTVTGYNDYPFSEEYLKAHPSTDVEALDVSATATEVTVQA